MTNSKQLIPIVSKQTGGIKMTKRNETGSLKGTSERFVIAAAGTPVSCVFI